MFFGGWGKANEKSKNQKHCPGQRRAPRPEETGLTDGTIRLIQNFASTRSILDLGKAPGPQIIIEKRDPPGPSPPRTYQSTLPAAVVVFAVVVSVVVVTSGAVVVAK